VIRGEVNKLGIVYESYIYMIVFEFYVDVLICLKALWHSVTLILCLLLHY